MKSKKSIEYGIGFADSEIIKYFSKDNNLFLVLKAWNETIIQFEFKDCILFCILDSWDISDICEVNNSLLFQRALKIVYEIIPEKHEYKLFQFFDNNDEPVVEVACQNVIITSNE